MPKKEEGGSAESNALTLMKYVLLLKLSNHHLQLQQAVIFLLINGFASICWLLTDQDGDF